jgi:hypothetical protein
MGCGDPDTGRGVHRVVQVPCKVAQRVVKHGHGLRRERKPRVGITDNGADGHDLLSCIGEWLRAIAGDRRALEYAFAIAPYDSGAQPILRADAAISARDRPTRRLIYDPNCEMAHRQGPFSLVVLSGWPPLGGFGRWRATRSRKWLRHEIEIDERTQLCYAPLVFVSGGLLCAVSIARPLWCGSVSFLSPP